MIHAVEVNSAVFHSSSCSSVFNQQEGGTPSLSPLQRGYTKLPNTILMAMVSADLSKVEIKILLLIARLSISFGRERVSLSKSSLSKYTGASGSVILEAVKKLERRGLIEKVSGDPFKSNQFRLVYSSTLFQKNENLSEDIGRVENLPQGSNSILRVGQKSAKTVVGKLPHFKQVSSNDNFKPLTISVGSMAIQSYFESCQPMRKKISEFKFYSELSEEFSELEISLGLEWVVKNGVIGTGEKCHSPMAYLSKALKEVLSRLEKFKPIKKEIAQANFPIANEDPDLSEDENTFKEKENQFKLHYPNEEDQKKLIHAFSKTMPFFNPDGEVLRKLAISYWVSQIPLTSS